MLNLTLFIYNFFTWLIVMFCLFVNALYEWNITKKNSSGHLNWQINIVSLYSHSQSHNACVLAQPLHSDLSIPCDSVC